MTVEAPFPANGQDPWGDDLRTWASGVEDDIASAPDLIALAIANALQQDPDSEEPYPRIAISSNPGGGAASSGELRLTFGKARQGGSFTSVTTSVGSPAAGATPTLNRIGVYTVDEVGDLTLIASTAHSATLWNATFTGYVTPLTSPAVLTRGQAYAVGLICVSTSPRPQWHGIVSPMGLIALNATPRLGGYLTGQTDLPASITAASLTGGASPPWARLS